MGDARILLQRMPKIGIRCTPPALGRTRILRAMAGAEHPAHRPHRISPRSPAGLGRCRLACSGQSLAEMKFGVAIGNHSTLRLDIRTRRAPDTHGVEGWR